MTSEKDTLRVLHPTYYKQIVKNQRQRILGAARFSKILKQISQVKPWRPKGNMMTN